MYLLRPTPFCVHTACLLYTVLTAKHSNKGVFISVVKLDAGYQNAWSPCVQYACHHSFWRASILAFCLGGLPAIYTIYTPCISFICSMYVYNYIHIWRAARNVKKTPANNYVRHPSDEASDIVLQLHIPPKLRSSMRYCMATSHGQWSCFQN